MHSARRTREALTLMPHRILLRAALVPMMLLGISWPAGAEPELVRSDLPLWSEAEKDVWPRQFQDKDSFGRASIFPIGDWRRKETTCDEVDPASCESWLRLDIAGLNDGGYLVAQCRKRSCLADVTPDFSVVADLGPVPSRPDIKLFAIQIGFLGGSEYVLVSTSDSPLIKHLDILSIDCEKAQIEGTIWRRANMLTVSQNAYCSVSSIAALRNLAVDATARAPEETLDFVAAPSE